MLFITGIPIAMSSVCFFSLIQKYLNRQEEGIFYALGLPFFGLAVITGNGLGSLYNYQWVTLN